MFRGLVCLSLLQYALGAALFQATDNEIRAISSQIWAADSNRITGSDVQYNVNGKKLFTYVNEARFTGTFARLIALLNNYTPETGIAETCGSTCTAEENAFLDAILLTRPMQLLQDWLSARGLASSSTTEFKASLRQYWFMRYSRSKGPLDSSGFEHVFLGEIKSNAVSGSHNWVNFYFEEKQGDLSYGPFISTCPGETVKFGFNWLNYKKPISSAFIRSSPEAEIALYTLCLLAKMGSNCPMQLGNESIPMTVWDMSGLPKTIGTAYPNC